MIQYSKLDEDLLKKHEVINTNDKKKELAKARKKRFNKRRIEQENKQRKKNQIKAKNKKYNASNRGKKEKYI